MAFSKRRLVFFGTPEWSVPVLTALADTQNLVAVVTAPDRRQGRGLLLTPSPVAQAANQLGLPVLKPEKLKDPEFLAALRGYQPEVAVTASYGKKIPRQVLELPPYGFLNLHPSLLPAYRGAAPVQRALMAGETSTGVTVMQTNEGMDTGPIILQEKVLIQPEETAAELSARLRDIGIPLLLKALEDIESLKPVPQAELGTQAPMLSPEEGLIDFTRPAQEIYNRHRGVQPWPGSYFQYQDQRIKVLELRPASGTQAAPGTILSLNGEALTVATGAGALELIRVRPEGKGTMSGTAWARGQRLAPGNSLVTEPES